MLKFGTDGVRGAANTELLSQASDDDAKALNEDAGLLWRRAIRHERHWHGTFTCCAAASGAG